MRTRRTNGSTTYEYTYNGDRLTQLVINTNGTVHTMYFVYDADGPMAVNANGTTYYYVKNVQGDITALVNKAGTAVVEYTYDAWGNIISVTGDYANGLGKRNPLRYRGYVYDLETELYYLQSRYYDPQVGRFINADALVSTGQGLLGNNMFAYCLNNPIRYTDTQGRAVEDAFDETDDKNNPFDDVGQMGGGGSVLGGLVVGAIVTTGAYIASAASTDSTIVMDMSYAVPVLNNGYYAKGGAAVLVDFDDGAILLYFHGGGGKGYSSGWSYSVGEVYNYEKPSDYAGWFVDVNIGYMIGVDHCWGPWMPYGQSPQAIAIAFSDGFSYGLGADYYFDPILLWDWKED